MTIIYHHSLALRDLATVLQESVHAEQIRSPLRSPIVVIPNMNIERWLKIHLPILSPSHMSLNLRFVFLEKILEELLSTSSHLNNSIQIYHHSEVEKLIFQYLLNNKDSSSFSFLGKYLDSPNRVFYLSCKLANYFKDYELNRSYWIHSWAKEKGIDIPSFSHSKIPSDLTKNPYYQLEKKIYCDLFLDKSQNFTTLSQYLLRSTLSPFTLEGTSLHLFCLANLSDTYLHVLQRLSSNSSLDVHFYQFHSGDRVEDNSKRKTSLSRWSYPQSFLAQSLSNLTKLSEVTPNPTSILKSIPIGLISLRDLLQGKADVDVPLLEGYGSTEDTSVRIWNAPSAYRELEAVANDIIHKMNQAKDQKSDLSLLDFSILVTNINEYRSAIEWVFDGGILIETSKNSHKKVERQKLPYSLVDLKASEASPMYRALSDFWELCNPTGFKFSDLRKILQNPLINTYLATDESAFQDFETLLITLGVAYEDVELQSLNDPFQISNGIRRAVLSSVFSENAAEAELNFAHIPIQNELAIIQLTEIWLRINNSRNKIFEFLKQGHWDNENFERMRFSLESLFQLDSEDLENRSLFHKFWNQLTFWNGIKLSENDGLEILKLLTLQAFDAISVKKGDYLTGGITISLLQPMRPLPFKHVYILGLGEGKFPSANDHSRLNLRNEIPEDWDLNKKQIQESLLWESLFSAQESITLSYVGKNTKEDKVFEPSSSLFEIMQSLGIHNATEIPLVAYSKSYDQNEMAQKAGLISYDFSRSFVRDPDCTAQILNEFQNIDVLTSTSNERQGKTKINLSELTQFVKDPLDTYLRKKLGMYLSDDMETEKEEIFHLDSLHRAVLQKKVYLTIFESLPLEKKRWERKEIETILDPIIDKEIKYGRFPNRVYSKLEKENILEHFADRETLFEEWSHLLHGAKYHRYVSFGNTGLNPNVCLKLPPLLFDSLPNFILQNECEHVFELNGSYHLIYTKRLESDVEENTEYNHYKDYFGNMADPFLIWTAFTMKGHSLKILTTNMKSKDGKLQGNLNFQTENEKTNANSYLESLIQAYTLDQPQFFPRILYLNFYYEMFGKTKSEPFTKGKLLEIEELWSQYQNEEIDTLYTHLTPISKLYPKTHQFLFQPNIEFAERFYAPISLWRKE